MKQRILISSAAMLFAGTLFAAAQTPTQPGGQPPTAAPQGAEAVNPPGVPPSGRTAPMIQPNQGTVGQGLRAPGEAVPPAGMRSLPSGEPKDPQVTDR